MSGLVADTDDEKETFHRPVQGRQDQDQVHPSEISSHVNDGEGIGAPVVGVSRRVSEKKLSNGDIYVGSWGGSFPDGTGKYLWSDGCMYEGEWARGKKTGGGKISWPSGATYEGELSGGYIQGVGTYTGVGDTMYRGSWIMNVKHGLGRKRYANGDVYEGLWKQGVQDGPGRYIWKNGNVYMGDWKGGIICGKGSIMWVNGDSFDGQWLDGLEHGHGIYTWADGSCYIGTWSRGLKDGKGTFYPPGTKPSGNIWIRHGSSTGNVSDEVTGSQHSHSYGSLFSAEHTFVRTSRRHSWTFSFDKVPTVSRLRKSESLPSQHVALERRWSLEGALDGALHFHSGNAAPLVAGELVCRGDEKKMEVTVLPIVEREYAQGVLISELVKDNLMSLSSKSAMRRQWRQAKDIKRPGETIIKGHRSYDLMLNLQLGIRYSIGRIIVASKRDIEPSDFGPKARIWMRFPRKGSQVTPLHQSIDFSWKDYCPMVFRNLREMFKIDAADYIMSICGNDALRELSSPGKSGSVFFLSNDDRFMIKTLRRSEVKVFLKMLSNYYNHLCKNENTLITKFFGLHQVKPAGGQKIRFVVMGNMFCTELRIHRRFDLKGSSQGRSTDKVEIDETTTLKDLDLEFIFHLEPSWRTALLKQIQEDCNFLKSQRIMDYSLLLGLHFRAPQYPKLSAAQPLQEDMETRTDDALLSIEEDWTYPQGLVLVTHEPKEGSSSGPHVRGSPLRAATAGHEVDLMLPGTNARLQVQLGVNMPARADRRPCNLEQNENPEGELFGEVYDVVLYFGIIDILQKYTIAKRIEHAYKSLHFSSVSISAVDPHLYSQRFQEFLQQKFPPSLY